MELFLRYFWFIGAAAALLNILVYKAAVSRRQLDAQEAKDAAKCFGIMFCFVSASSAIVGVLHLSADFQLPMVPFASPLTDSFEIRASWCIALGTVLLSLLYINTRDERISHIVAEILVADLFQGKTALRVINTFAPALTIVVLVSSMVAGWTGGR